MADVQAILEFWFGDGSGRALQHDRREWFQKNPAFDREIETRFRTPYEQAAAGKLDGWRNTPEGTLALIILLDQFPRNMFRNQPQAFATDARARELTRWAIAQQFDQALSPFQRRFLYMPLQHSESLDDQVRSVFLFSQLTQEEPGAAEALDYAIRHRDVIARFGRFPHRNAVLGRSSTEAETEFLKQKGSRF